MKKTTQNSPCLPPVIVPTLSDIEIQVARLRASQAAKHAYAYKNTHDYFSRHVSAILSVDPINENDLGAVAFSHSLASSPLFHLPPTES